MVIVCIMHHILVICVDDSVNNWIEEVTIEKDVKQLRKPMPIWRGKFTDNR